LFGTLLHEDFIYVHFPKTGGHFIHNFLIDNIEGCYFQDKRDKMMPLLKIEDRNKFSFGFVRNPFSWYVSWWAKKYKNRPSGSKLALGDKINEFDSTLYASLKGVNSSLDAWYDPNRLNDLDIGIVTWLYIYYFCNYNKVKTLDDVKDNILIDKVMYFEELTTELYTLFSKSPFSLSKEKRTKLFTSPKLYTSEHSGNVMEYYDRDLIQFITYKDRFVFDLFSVYKDTKV
jgi:hypothetical protein